MKAVFLGGMLAAWLSGSLTGAPLGLDSWKSWSPREGIAPEFAHDVSVDRAEGGSLRIQTRKSSDYGAWQRTVEGIAGGKSYRFTAFFQTRNVPNEVRSVIPRLEWVDARGTMVRPPEYAVASSEEKGWRRVDFGTTAPEGATAVKIQLGFGFAAEAAVWWDDISLTEESLPPARHVRAVTIFHRPRGTKSARASVEEFCALARQAAGEKPDIVCLPEGITVVGTGQSYWEVGESLPGPTTERLGTLARELHSYVVAGLYEKEGVILYNTAVLIGRDGKIAGKYRKTHLPREEWEAGITPGDQYPVFQTDFGTVGLMICWDVQFPEPARAMARQGAEVLLLPIWGGNEVLAKARAIENHVFLVSSSYDMKTFIVDPVGSVLAEADSAHPLASASLSLDQKFYQPWLGDMKYRTWKERRPDIPIDPPSAGRASNP